MSNLIDLQNQIEKLQKQANDIKSKEFDKTVQEILGKMKAFGISVKDLQSASASGKSKNISKPRRGAGQTTRSGIVKVAAKYSGPGGETWSGRGLTPRWLAALIAEGRKKEEFAIQK